MKIFRRIEHLIHHTLLRVDAAEISPLRRGYRLLYYTLRGVNAHRTMVDSAALTLYTFFALVPILALVLIVLGQLGIIEKGVTLLYDAAPKEWYIVLDNLLEVARSAAANVAPGFLAVVGIATLMFAIFTLFRTAEASFNRVWDISESRGFLHRYTAYIIVALFVPTMLLAAMSFAYDLLAMAGLGEGLSGVAGNVLSLVLVAMAMMLVYKYLPYTRVRWSNALYAGLFSGLGLSLWMWGYVYFQQMMTSYNVIYGSLAAVPLFIVWLQVSWNIILVGCELCAVMQHRHRYERIDRWRIRGSEADSDSVRVVIIGSGNVAEAFARSMGRISGVRLLQLCSRNRERGMAVAKLGGCSWVADPEHIADADIYIIAVSDRAVTSVAESLKLSDTAIVVHTAGSIPLDALKSHRGGRGIFYPLQSFSSGRIVSLDEVPIFVEADCEATRERLMSLARRISTRVEYADSRRRRVIHLAGVFVNNFPNHLYGLGADIVEREGLSFDILKPLIAETAAKAIAVDDPESVQTGPAVRGDGVVTAAHEAMLADDELKQRIYKYITESIWETSKKI